MRCFPLVAALCLTACAHAQDPPAIETIVAAHHTAGQFDGVVLVAEGGEVLHRSGVGLANAEWGVPNTPEARFHIASVSKMFTAALVLQLTEDGLVDLHAPISDYLPDVRRDFADRVTTHQLLSHTSGIPDYVRIPTFDDVRRDPHTPEELLALVDHLPLDFEPGTGTRYSNTAYVLLGLIIEAVTDQPLAMAYRDRLFTPLGLTDTAYDDDRVVLPRSAHRYAYAAGRLRAANPIHGSFGFGAGGIRSTVVDLAIWAEALENGRVFQKPETRALMNTPHAEIPGRDGRDRWGYGVMLRQLAVGEHEIPVVEHDGRSAGATSVLRYISERDIVIVALSNTASDFRPMVHDITSLLHGGEVELPQPSVLRRVRLALASGGTSAAAEAFRTALANGDATEDDLNTLGYEQLGWGDGADAVALFRLNAETYPESWNVHDSLGEGLATIGRRDEAIAAYERSLELNPDNTNGRAVLDRLRRE